MKKIFLIIIWLFICVNQTFASALSTKDFDHKASTNKSISQGKQLKANLQVLLTELGLKLLIDKELL